MSLKFIQLDSFYEQMFKIQDLLERINSLFRTLVIFQYRSVKTSGKLICTK